MVSDGSEGAVGLCLPLANVSQVTVGIPEHGAAYVAGGGSVRVDGDARTVGLCLPLAKVAVRVAEDGAAHVAGRVSEGVGMEGNAGSVERSVGLGLGFTLAEGMAHQGHGPAAKAG